MLRCLLACAIAALAITTVQAKPRLWIEREYTQPATPPLADVERLLNTECRPSGLDGIQSYAIQKGHEDAMHLHIACRQDGSRARYRVTIRTAPRGQIGAIVRDVMHNPRLRIGPFHFGEAGGDDGIILIERL